MSTCLIAAIWQDHEDQQRVEACAGQQKRRLAQSVSSASCKSAAVTRFHLSRPATLPSGSVELSENIAAVLSGRFFTGTVAARSSRQFTDLYLAELAENIE